LKIFIILFTELSASVPHGVGPQEATPMRPSTDTKGPPTSVVQIPVLSSPCAQMLLRLVKKSLPGGGSGHAAMVFTLSLLRN
jgi:hypothetical protein